MEPVLLHPTTLHCSILSILYLHSSTLDLLPIPSFLYLRCCVFYLLHCVTVYCIVLQCGASCCSKLQRLVVPKEAEAAGDCYWHVLSICAAVCCIVLQCVASCCSVLHSEAAICSVALFCGAVRYVAVCCSVSQRVAACCSVSQRVAACCSVFHCVVVRCSVLQCVAL